MRINLLLTVRFACLSRDPEYLFYDVFDAKINVYRYSNLSFTFINPYLLLSHTNFKMFHRDQPWTFVIIKLLLFATAQGSSLNISVPITQFIGACPHKRHNLRLNQRWFHRALHISFKDKYSCINNGPFESPWPYKETVKVANVPYYPALERMRPQAALLNFQIFQNRILNI